MTSQLEWLTASIQNMAAQTMQSTAAKTDSSETSTDDSFQTLLNQKQQNTVQDRKTSQKTDDRSASSNQTDNSTPQTEQNTGITDRERELAAALVQQATVVVPVEQTAAPETSQEPQLTISNGMAGVQQSQPLTAGDLLMQQTIPDAAATVDTTVSAPAELVSLSTAAPAVTPPSIPTQTDVQTDAQSKTAVDASATETDTTEAVTTVQTTGSSAQSESKTDNSLLDSADSQSTTTADDTETKSADVDVPQSTPLFRDLKEVPVKVADAEPIDTQSVDMESQLADQITGSLSQGTEKIVIQLSPESLGNVTIEMTRAQDGTLHVALSTTNESARSLLEQHSLGLQSLLTERTDGAVSVQVTKQQESQNSNSSTYGDREGQNQQQQSGQDSSRQRRQNSDDFMQRFRLGLLDAVSAET